MIFKFIFVCEKDVGIYGCRGHSTAKVALKTVEQL